MKLNKTLTIQKEEESSSLTGLTNQGLLFCRHLLTTGHYTKLTKKEELMTSLSRWLTFF